MQILAIQDLDCIDRAKFRYLLPMPPPDGFLDRFEDAVVTMRRFSQFSPLARDMYSVRKSGVFLAEGVFGGQEIVVSFLADADPLPTGLMDDFAAALSGMGEVVYGRGAEPQCHSCVAGSSKPCRRWTASRQ